MPYHVCSNDDSFADLELFFDNAKMFPTNFKQGNTSNVVFVNCFNETELKGYGSLYVTLCFVSCRFYFGVLTLYVRILSFLFMCSVYDVAYFKRRNSRGRNKI